MLDWREGEWVVDVPFASVDPELIEQLALREFSLQEYMGWARFMDTLPMYWNMVLMVEGVQIAFAYGVHNFLEKESEMKRTSIKKEYWADKWPITKDALRVIKELCAKVDIQHIYGIFPKWEGYLKGLPDTFKVYDSKVMEVL